MSIGTASMQHCRRANIIITITVTTNCAQALHGCLTAACSRCPVPPPAEEVGYHANNRFVFAPPWRCRLQHLFKILYRLLDYHHDLRDRLAYYGADAVEANAVIREVSKIDSFPPTDYIAVDGFPCDDIVTAGAVLVAAVAILSQQYDDPMER